MKKLASGWILFGSVALLADYTVVLQMQDPDHPEDKMQTVFKYKDAGHGRIDYRISEQQLKSSMLLKGEKTYMISYDEGEVNVMDMDAMKAMMDQFGGAEPPEPEAHAQKDEALEWHKTGRHKTIAGIRGEVWEVEYLEDGKKKKAEMVLTKDKDYVKAMKAYEEMLGNMAGEEAEKGFMEVKPGYAPLQMEGAFVLKSFSEKRLDPADFELPEGAAVQKNPFGAMFASGGSKNKSGTGGGALADACYDQVCCGQVQGDAEVLPSMLSKEAEGYRLIETAKCDFLSLGALLGVDSVEGAMYKKGKSAVTVTLEMDAKDKGNILKTKAADGPAKVTRYKSGFIGEYAYHYGVLQPMNVQELDIIVDDHTNISLSHPAAQGKVPLVKFAKEAIDFETYASSVKTKKHAKKTAEPSEDGEDGLTSEKINDSVDKAVDLFKSLF